MMNVFTPDYSEFSDPRLVAIYDIVNPIDSYQNFYVKTIKELSPKSIADIGCGSGLLTYELAKNGFQMIGIEPSASLLELARKRSGENNIKWVKGYIEKLQSEKVDLVIMTGHVAQFYLSDKEWESALTIVHSSLLSGGHFIFESRNPLVPIFESWPTQVSPRTIIDPVAGEVNWWANILEKKYNKISYELHYQFFNTHEELVSKNELVFRSREEILQSLLKVGLKIEKIYGDWDAASYDEKSSPEMIFIVSKM